MMSKIRAFSAPPQQLPVDFRAAGYARSPIALGFAKKILELLPLDGVFPNRDMHQLPHQI